MLMKSVPPVVVPTLRHRLIANPLIIPPNTLISRISSVKCMEEGYQQAHWKV